MHHFTYISFNSTPISLYDKKLFRSFKAPRSLEEHTKKCSGTSDLAMGGRPESKAGKDKFSGGRAESRKDGAGSRVLDISMSPDAHQLVMSCSNCAREFSSQLDFSTHACRCITVVTVILFLSLSLNDL